MADDYFETYFAEKLWEMIPAVYRHEDGLGDNPGVLRALVEVLASQAAILRRSHDRLWEDQFIELCDDWAVPYLGDLVGARLVSALNRRGRRVDVAKTIYYRRRKGTLTVLEELIGDITGWEGTVVESFRRLGRARHRLDPPPASLAGRFSGTPPGGWADLRRPRAAELTGGPFDEFHHTPDVRRHRGLQGHYNIPKLAFYLYRLRAFPVTGVTPYAAFGDTGYTFDPSGRDVPLFAPRGRPAGWEVWRRAREWELPGPIRCRVLGHAEYEIDEALILDMIDQHSLDSALADELRGLRGWRFRDENRLRLVLEALDPDLLDDAIYPPLAAGALAEDCGKHALLPDALQVQGIPGDPIPPEETAAGDLSTWMAIVSDKRLVVDPQRGRFIYLDDLPVVGLQRGRSIYLDDPPAEGFTVTYHYGFSGEIGAGTYDRRAVEEREPDYRHTGGGGIPAGEIENHGVTQIDDSATYGPVGNKLGVRDLTLQAANRQRPYLCLEGNWRLNTGSSEDSVLLLEGLWIGTQLKGPVAVILRGDYERVTLRNVTLDPGGERREDSTGDALPTVSLVIEGHIELLEIASSITGPIRTQEDGVVEELVVHDSILQSRDPTVPALDLDGGAVTLERVTLFGTLDVHRLWASEALITGTAQVTDTQTGCFRFSAAQAGSRLPRPYEPHWLTDSEHLFTSSRFGHPGFAQLSEAAPEELRRGAENGSEIGAFSGLLNPIKLDSLHAKVDEFMPFGLIPLFIYQT